MKNAKRWLLSFAAIVLAVVLLLSITVFVVDPAFQFRVRDNTYILSSRYVSPGLIKNHNYDTILFGSSMAQNFDMDLFEKHLGGDALKIGVSSMNAIETVEFLELAYASDKAERFFLCIDISSFREYGDSKNEQFLFKNDLLSYLRYFVDYKTWLRYLPMGIATSALKSINKMPESLAEKTNIDLLDDWSADHTCSRDVVVKKYLNNTDGVSKVDLENLEQNLKDTIDIFFSNIDTEQGEHIFFFPPYSSLFWCTAQDDGYFEIYIKAKEYFYKIANEHNCSVYDFQTASFTSDLDNYRDLTHYGKHINDWMIEHFKDDSFLVTSENSQLFSQNLRHLTESFRIDNSELFE